MLAALTLPLENLIDFMSTVGSQNITERFTKVLDDYEGWM